MTRILLLEDTPADAKSILGELRRADPAFDSKWVEREGDWRIALRDFAPDVILAGHPLQRFDGIHAVRAIRELAPRVPIIVVSGELEADVAVDYLKAGAADCVARRSLARLKPAIREALAKTGEEEQASLAAQALRQSEARFRELFEIAQDIIFNVSAADGTFASLNPAFEKLTGWPRREWIGRPYTDLVCPEDLVQAGRRFREVLDGEVPRRLQLRLRTRSGAVLHAEVIASRQVQDGRVTGLFGIARDITAPKQTEAALRESEDRFKVFMDNSSTVAFIKDEAGRYLYGNKPWAEQFGRPAAELLGQTDYDLWPAALAEQFRASDVAALAAGKSIDVGESGETEDGRLRHWMVFKFPVQEASGRRLVGGVALDITPRKHAEEALRRSETHFRSLIENALDIITVLKPDGTVVYESPSVERVLGYSPAEFVGRSVADWIHPDDVAAVTGALADAVQTPDPGEILEFRRRHRDGSWRVFEGAGKNLPPEAGLIGVVINSRDVTERKRLEDQLRQAQKMEAVGRLAGGVAHDFNNLLLAILGYADMLLGWLDATNPGREEVHQIKKAGERAASLTRQLLAFSRKQVLQPTVLDLNSVITDLDKMLRRLLGENLQLAVVLAPDVGKVRADQGQIEQVIMNLAVNARDAMAGGGKLTIETANAEVNPDPAPGGSGLPAGSYVSLAVTDTGCGMSEEVRSHLFEPFFTTKERGKGTGLGLSTVYGIVKQSGGDITVISDVGRGTRFRILLPRVEQPVAKVESPMSAVDSPRGVETVLLVEDEDAVRTLLGRILQNHGYTVLDACCSDEAIELSKFHPGPIQLLVTDLVMPGMNGRELVEHLTPTRPEMKVLCISGYTDDAVFQQGLLEAGMAFLQKPFAPATLLCKTRAVLDTPRQPGPPLRAEDGTVQSTPKP